MQALGHVQPLWASEEPCVAITGRAASPRSPGAELLCFIAASLRSGLYNGHDFSLQEIMGEHFTLSLGMEKLTLSLD